MQASIRVNVHPRPRSRDWDVHIPYYGNSYNQNKHVQDSYLQQFIELVNHEQTIILISDGEPLSRQYAVKSILDRYYNNTLIEHKPARYNNNADPLFNNSHFCTIPRPNALNDRDIIDFYLKNYPQMHQFSQNYTYKYHSRDHGYFSAVKRYWYQFGDDMPTVSDTLHLKMYSKLRECFESIVESLMALPLRMSARRIRQNLMLRLNHNPPNSEILGYLTPRHADNSIVTLWLHQNYQGAIIDQGQIDAVDCRPIDQLYNSCNQILVFPGFDYCDQLKTMTSATWHSVVNHDNVDRASLVAFLKY